MVEDEPIEPWEVPELRATLSVAIQRALKSPTRTVAVSRRKVDLIRATHATDWQFFGRLTEVIEEYEYWGHSPKRTDAIELYKRLDGIWFTVVIFAPGPNTGLNSLGTMHRIDRRKVESRCRKYLQVREEGEQWTSLGRDRTEISGNRRESPFTHLEVHYHFNYTIRVNGGRNLRLSRHPARSSVMLR